VPAGDRPRHNVQSALALRQRDGIEATQFIGQQFGFSHEPVQRDRTVDHPPRLGRTAINAFRG
jgi:hypothetical protein